MIKNNSKEIFKKKIAKYKNNMKEYHDNLKEVNNSHLQNNLETKKIKL